MISQNNGRTHTTSSLSIKKMYMTLWLKQTWTDDRLAWNPDEWDNIQRLRLPVGEVWKPDLSNYNGKMEVVQNSVYDKMTEAVILADGKVTHVPMMKVKSETYTRSMVSSKSSSTHSRAQDYVALPQTRGRIMANRT